MRSHGRINYKGLSKTEDSEMSTLLRSISISEEEDNMDKQRIASLKVDDFGLAEDIADCIDENHVSDSRRN